LKSSRSCQKGLRQKCGRHIPYRDLSPLCKGGAGGICNKSMRIFIRPQISPTPSLLKRGVKNASAINLSHTPAKMSGCGLQEITNTPDHQNNQPFKIAHFNWISLKYSDSLQSFFFLKKLTFHPRIRKHFYVRQQTRFETRTLTPVRKILIICDVEMLTG
jgi:hypothetical protein